MRNSIVVAIAVCFVITVLSFASCDRSGRHGEGVTSRLDTGNSIVGARSSTPDSNADRTLSIEQAIADAREYIPPASATNNAEFDPLVFEMLRAEFTRLIEQSSTRSTSAAPMGDAGRVTDLTYDDAGRLNWTYVNVGDYDSSGEVGIPDITMIAQYYLADISDGIGNDALETWIDGDKSGEVGISDITPIAQGYLNTVMEYRILTSSQPGSGFTAIGSPVPFGSTGVFPHTFSVLLPASTQQYVAVAPVDDHGEQGEIGNAIPIAGSQDPEIINISGNSYTGNEIHCAEGVEFEISAAVFGTEPITYSWNFGDGASPTTTADETPFITPKSAGSYSCSLSIANTNGLDTYDFTLFVEARPKIVSVTPKVGEPGTVLIIKATVKGDNLTYSWDFSDGAIPSTSTEPSPQIILNSTPGTYDAILSVSNAWGTDLYEFHLTISYAEWRTETVDSINSVGDYVSLKLDSNDRPHISYYDWSTDNLKYANYNGLFWNTTSLDNIGEYGGYTSLGLDSNGNPHISYYDSISKSLKYAYFTGSDWSISTVDSSTDSTHLVGQFSSIVIDSQNYPYISYAESDTPPGRRNLKCAHFSGVTWDITDVQSTGEGVGDTSIVLDSNELPRISYISGTSMSLKYALFNGESWEIAWVDPEGSKYRYTSIDLDSDDSPHISCYDYTNNNLKYAYYNNSTWIIQTVDSDGDVGQYTSIAVDSNDQPHISYYDATNGTLKYAYCINSSWEIETLDYAYGFTSIALDSNDRPHIGYRSYELIHAWFG